MDETNIITNLKSDPEWIFRGDRPELAYHVYLNKFLPPDARIDDNLLSKFPDSVKTQKTCEIVVGKNGVNIQYAPAALKKNLIARAINSTINRGKAIQFAASMQVPKDSIKIAAREVADTVMYVKEQIDEEIALILVKHHRAMLGRLEPKLRTREICREALRLETPAGADHVCQFGFVPDEFKAELADVAVKTNPAEFSLFEGPLRTQARADFAVRADINNFKFIPAPEQFPSVMKFAKHNIDDASAEIRQLIAEAEARAVAAEQKKVSADGVKEILGQMIDIEGIRTIIADKAAGKDAAQIAGISAELAKLGDRLDLMTHAIADGANRGLPQDIIALKDGIIASISQLKTELGKIKPEEFLAPVLNEIKQKVGKIDTAVITKSLDSIIGQNGAMEERLARHVDEVAAKQAAVEASTARRLDELKAISNSTIQKISSDISAQLESQSRKLAELDIRGAVENSIRDNIASYFEDVNNALIEISTGVKGLYSTVNAHHFATSQSINSFQSNIEKCIRSNQDEIKRLLKSAPQSNGDVVGALGRMDAKIDGIIREMRTLNLTQFQERLMTIMNERERLFAEKINTFDVSLTKENGVRMTESDKDEIRETLVNSSIATQKGVITNILVKNHQELNEIRKSLEPKEAALVEEIKAVDQTLIKTNEELFAEFNRYIADGKATGISDLIRQIIIDSPMTPAAQEAIRLEVSSAKELEYREISRKVNREDYFEKLHSHRGFIVSILKDELAGKMIVDSAEVSEMVQKQIKTALETRKSWF